MICPLDFGEYTPRCTLPHSSHTLKASTLPPPPTHMGFVAHIHIHGYTRTQCCTSSLLLPITLYCSDTVLTHLVRHSIDSIHFLHLLCPVMRATVLHIYHGYMPPMCEMRLLVRVRKQYKGPHAQSGSVRTICIGKSPVPIEIGMDYLFAGDYDRNGMGFVIKPSGYVEAWSSERGSRSDRKARRC